MNASLSKKVSSPPLSNQRIHAFDLARGLAILFMMIVHTMDFYGAPAVHETFIGTYFKAFVGWPAASTFIFIMGIFIAYTPNATLSQGLKRAAFLFLLGYLLNLFRGTIPMWLSIQFGFVTYEELGGHTPLTEFLIVDILQFAGIAFAVCCLLQHYLPHPKYWLIAALIVNCASPMLWDITTGVVYVDEFLKLFCGNKDIGAPFPQFPWLTYPLVGMAFGHWLKNTDDVKAFFNKAFGISVIAMALGLGIVATDVDFHLADNLRGGPGLVVCITSFTVMALYLCHFLVSKIPHNPVFSLLYTWSKHVTAVYFIHWTIIGWGLMKFGVQTLDSYEVMLAMLGVIVLSDAIMRVWAKIKSKQTKDIVPEVAEAGA